MAFWLTECIPPVLLHVGLVSKPRPSGLGSQPHSIVKKLAISRARKTQQQTKKETPETTDAPTAVTSAKPSAVELQKKRELETKPVPNASAVTEEKKETGTTGKSSMSLPPNTVGMLVGLCGCYGDWLPGYCNVVVGSFDDVIEARAMVDIEQSDVELTNM